MTDGAQKAIPVSAGRFTLVQQGDIVLKKEHPGADTGDEAPAEPVSSKTAPETPHATRVEESKGMYKITKQAGIMLKEGEYATRKVRRLLYGCYVVKLEEGERSDNWRIRCVTTGAEGWCPSSVLAHVPTTVKTNRAPASRPMRLSSTFIPLTNLARRSSVSSRDSLNLQPLKAPPPVVLRFVTTIAAHSRYHASRSSLASATARPTLATTTPMRIATPHPTTTPMRIANTASSATVRTRQQPGGFVGILKNPGYGFSSTMLGNPSVRFSATNEDPDDMLSMMEEMQLNLATQMDETEESPSPVPMSQEMSPSKGISPQKASTSWRRWMQSLNISA
eukprot:GEMP01046734.1.p1 GENE.GEMP01046734.1~~GEMP01046734.1.p1  ORF type:complete len:336 (+),score=81.10 GEMP01046734.1:55-1062(+)